VKESTTTRFKEGLAVRKNVLGADYVDTAFQNADGDPISVEVQEMVTEFGWGVVWTRPGLSLKIRSMLNLAMLTALNRPHEFETHLKGAINNGVTKDEIKEILFQSAVYCGWPAAIDSFRIAKRIFAETNIPT
tara:strand:+ start:115 stop:513 length:399 start_codon:yes stop_codon:yes gene_type:complete